MSDPLNPTALSYVECDVPKDMTLRQWRRARQTATRGPIRRRGLRIGSRRHHPVAGRRALA